MGVDPLSLAIGGLSAAASFSEAQGNNQRTRQAADATKATENVAARQRKEITARNLQELEGTLRASAAGRGVAGSASTEALSLSQFESALLEQENIELNRFFANTATDARASAQFQNPLLAGIQGFSTGLSIGGSISDTFSSDPTQDVTQTIPSTPFPQRIGPNRRP